VQSLGKCTNNSDQLRPASIIIDRCGEQLSNWFSSWPSVLSTIFLNFPPVLSSFYCPPSGVHCLRFPPISFWIFYYYFPFAANKRVFWAESFPFSPWTRREFLDELWSRGVVTPTPACSCSSCPGGWSIRPFCGFISYAFRCEWTLLMRNAISAAHGKSNEVSWSVWEAAVLLRLSQPMMLMYLCIFASLKAGPSASVSFCNFV